MKLLNLDFFLLQSQVGPSKIKNSRSNSTTLVALVITMVFDRVLVGPDVPHAGMPHV